MSALVSARVGSWGCFWFLESYSVKVGSRAPCKAGPTSEYLHGAVSLPLTGGSFTQWQESCKRNLLLESSSLLGHWTPGHVAQDMLSSGSKKPDFVAFLEYVKMIQILKTVVYSKTLAFSSSAKFLLLAKKSRIIFPKHRLHFETKESVLD